MDDIVILVDMPVVNFRGGRIADVEDLDFVLKRLSCERVVEVHLYELRVDLQDCTKDRL